MLVHCFCHVVNQWGFLFYLVPHKVLLCIFSDLLIVKLFCPNFSLSPGSALSTTLIRLSSLLPQTPPDLTFFFKFYLLIYFIFAGGHAH